MTAIYYFHGKQAKTLRIAILQKGLVVLAAKVVGSRRAHLQASWEKPKKGCHVVRKVNIKVEYQL